ncbi:MAG: flagellar basal body P-ring formation chaperone FlgA [Planctomycetota bacterium]
MTILFATLLLTAAPAVTVDLPMEAHVQGTAIELGEIARVSGADAGAVQLVAAVELGYSPSPGYSRLLHAERIRAIVASQAPQVEVRFIGQRAIRVWPEVDEIPDAEIEGAALAELRRAYAASDASFAPAGLLTAVAVPSGARGRELRARVDEQRLASGTISVPVDVLVDGAVYRTVWTSWRAEVYETLPVLKQAVPAGATLAPEMLERRRVRLAAGGGAKPLDPSRLVGAVAARDLVAGEIVADGDVHRPVVVNAGDTLFLRVRKGGIEAQVPAVALAGGASGDRIRVRTVERGQELTAVIRSRDVVEIDLGR